ncbi:MAG: hypothetical protein KHY83_08730 [Coriobacteriia bacterium]|nr:hypothetical protein [Coriobacteriia bacterium]MBS5478731.1 hypothetical protein [Coriobacteriia bacterium]
MAECEMTCRAGMRVLYELAGASRKRWSGLDEDLRATPGTAKRVFARNDNWPQQFGAVNYKDLVTRYALDEYSTLYGALVTIKETLRSFDAYTPEVDAIVSGIDADTDEATIEACIERLSDVIYATARPASRAAGVRDAAENVRADAKPGLDDRLNVRLEKKAEPDADADRAEAPAYGMPAAMAGVGEAGHGSDSASSVADASRELSFADVRELLCGGPRRVLLRTYVDDEALLAELLPPDVMTDVRGAHPGESAETLPQAVRDELALRLCTDGGMACRELLRRCERLMRAADRDAFVTGVAALEERRGLRADIGGARATGVTEPDYLAEPFGYLATRFSADPPRRLFVLALLALLGRDGTATVLRRLHDEPGLLAGNL